MYSRISAILVFAATPIAFAPAPVAAAGACQISIVAEFAVDNAVSHRVITHGEVNGKPVRVLIDTGASFSALLQSAVPGLGLKLVDASGAKVYGIGGASKIRSAHVDELKISRFVTKDINFPAVDSPDKSIDLVLGEDVLSRYTLEFDLGHQAVRLLTHKDCSAGQLAYWAKAYSVAELVASPRTAEKIQPTLTLNGRAIRAELDSGASFTVVSSSFARNAGVGSVMDAGKSVGVGREALDVQAGTFSTIALGDEVIKNVTLELAELNQNIPREETGSRIVMQEDVLPKMLLGADFLLSHRVVIPADAKLMVFTYEGGPVFLRPHRQVAAPEQSSE